MPRVGNKLLLTVRVQRRTQKLVASMISTTDVCVSLMNGWMDEYNLPTFLPVNGLMTAYKWLKNANIKAITNINVIFFINIIF